jgi:hypothetical protein
MAMTIEEAIDNLTAQTTSLLETCTTLKGNVNSLISNAIALSENRAIEPLFIVSTNLINTQTLLITILNR